VEASGWLSLADLAAKAGIPTALGCAIVWYLLWHHIPKLTSTFEAAIAGMTTVNAAQRDECKQAIAAQQQASDKLVELLSKQIASEAEESRRHRAEEAAQTRAALADLAVQTRKLGAAVHRMSGRLKDDDDDSDSGKLDLLPAVRRS